MAENIYSEDVRAAVESLDGNFNLKKATEEFTLAWNSEKMRRRGSARIEKSEKSKMEADRLRNEGNSFYKKRNFVKALELYNQSIRHAPHPVVEALTQQGEPTCDSDSYEYPRVDPIRYGGTVEEESETLAKGYSSRSALLYEIKCYDKCLADIDLALETGCSEDISKRLTSRKEKCLKAIKENLPLKSDLGDIISRLQKVFTGMPEYDSNWKVKSVHRMLLERHLKRKEISLYHKLHDEHLVDILSLEAFHLPSLEETNPSYPALSSKVTVAYIPTKGRGIVATKDLKPGDIIGIERSPFTFIEWVNLDAHCSYCLKICLTPVPCPSCCKVIYCGILCRDKGLSEDHWLECKIRPMLKSLQSFAMMKCFRFSQLKEMVLKLGEEKVTSQEKAGCNRKGVYSSTSFQIVHHLQSRPTKTIPTDEHLERLHIAITATNLLLDCGRFFLNEKYQRIVPSKEDIILTGSVVYSFMMKWDVNEMLVEDAMLQKSIGLGVFPTLTLLNNACNANATCIGERATKLVVARNFIKTGEEVTIPYVFDYSDAELKIRQAGYLHKYIFECKCDACLNKWPNLVHQNKLCCKCLKCSKEIKDRGWICEICFRDIVKRGLAKRGVFNKKIIKKEEELKGYIIKLAVLVDSLPGNRLLTESQALFVWEAANKVCKHLLEPCRSWCVIMSLIEYAFHYIPNKNPQKS